MAEGQNTPPPGITVDIDGLGTSATLVVDLTVHSLTAVLKTAYWYTDRFYLFLHRPDGVPERVSVEIRAKDVLPGADLLVEACQEFGNALLDQTVRQQVLAETSALRDALVRKAFGEGRPHRDPQTLADPHAIHLDGTFDSDPLGIRMANGAHASAD